MGGIALGIRQGQPRGVWSMKYWVGIHWRKGKDGRAICSNAKGKVLRLTGIMAEVMQEPCLLYWPGMVGGSSTEERERMLPGLKMGVPSTSSLYNYGGSVAMKLVSVSGPMADLLALKEKSGAAPRALHEGLAGCGDYRGRG